MLSRFPKSGVYSKAAIAFTAIIFVSACSGSSQKSDNESNIATTIEATPESTTTTAATTTTIDPNLDPYYPELGEPWGIGEELATQFGPDVAAFCLLTQTFDNLPDSARYRDINAIGERLATGIYGDNGDLSPLRPYMELLQQTADHWKEFYPTSRMDFFPYSVSADLTYWKNDPYYQPQSPSCSDTKFIDWLNYKGFIDQGKAVLGTK
jgi:hypothetical protein